MPLVAIPSAGPLIDGRQSERAMLVRRGVQALLADMRLAALAELPLANGRRADLMALSRRGEIWIIEIKSSREDLRADRKWPDYRAYCDRLFFATHGGVPLDLFPRGCGLFVSDGYGAAIVREAPEHQLSAARRKALTIDFARAGADRLLAAERAVCER